MRTRPLHLLFVTGEYPPQSGGVGAYTAELARALCDLEVTVSVITSADVGLYAGDSRIAVYPVIQRWNVGIWRTIARVAEAGGADWIHVQYQTAAFGMNPAINFAPAWWQGFARSRWRVAWTYHDLLPPYLFPKAGSRLRTWVTLRPALTSDFTIVTNEGDRVALASKAGAPHSIPIGSNIQRIALDESQREAVRGRYGYTNSDPLLGYFGFLNRSKGALALVHTLHHLVRAGLDVKLLMVGDPLGASDPTNLAYRDEVMALISQLGLTQRIRWTGNLADADVGEALNALDVLILPYEDGASLRRGTLMAGLANGCAIVTTTPQTPLTELADGKDLLYAPPSNPAALASAVRSLLEQPALSAALRSNARNRSADFSWQRIAERHLALYAAAR